MRRVIVGVHELGSIGSATMVSAQIVKFCFRGLSTSSASPPKPRLRKSERLQRDVQLLSRILRSKATWGASTVKRLKQSNVEVTPYHVTEVLRRHKHGIDPAWRFFRWAQQQKRCKRGVFVYSKMAQLLGDARRFGELWTLLDDMKRARRPIPASLFLGVIRSYATAGDVPAALAAFRAMPLYHSPPSTLVLNSMLRILISSQHHADAESLFHSSPSPDHITFTMMIDLKGKLGHIDAAFELFHEMHRRGHQANVVTYSSLITSLAKAGRVSEACTLLSGMKINGVEANSVTYNGLIASLGVGELAYAYYREMLSLGLVPNVVTQGVVIASLVQLGDLTEAKDLFQTAVTTRSSFDVMKSVVCKVGACDSGLRFFREVKRGGYEASVGAYSVLIGSLSKSGCVGEAMDLFRELECTGRSPDVVALHALVNALVKEEKLDGAVDVMRFMIKRKIGDGMCEKLVDLLCKSNRFEDAYEVLREKSSPRLYNKLVYRLGQAGRIEEALKAFERMKDDGCRPDVETYDIVINLLGSVGKVDLGYQLFQQMKKDGCEPGVQTYGIMVGRLVRSGRSVLSIRVCQEMVSHFPGDALEVLRQTQEAIGGVEDSREYGELVNTCTNLLKGDGSALVIKDTS